VRDYLSCKGYLEQSYEDRRKGQHDYFLVLSPIQPNFWVTCYIKLPAIRNKTEIAIVMAIFKDDETL